MSTTFKTNVQDATINNTLTVDTNTLYVDPVNNGVCVGTTTLTTGNKLTISGKADFADILGLPKIATGSLPTASSYEGYVAYDDTLNKFVYSNGSIWVDPSGGGGGMSVGGSVTSGTTGSILFVGSGPVLAQDNANLFWDDTNNRLGIGTTSPASAFDILPITVTTQATNYVSGANIGGTYTKNDANTRIFHGLKIHPTLNTGGSNANTTLNVLSVDTTNTAVTGLTTNLINASYGGTTKFTVGSDGYTVNGGTRMIVEGNQIWKDATPTKAVHQGMKVPGGAITDDYIFSTNNGSTWTERLRIANATGLATFANAVAITGNLTVDTNTISTDTTNNRVGIGVTSPTRALDIRSSEATTPVQVVATSTSGYSGVVFCDTANAAKGSIGYGQSATPSPYTSTFYLNASSGVDTIFATNGTERLRMASGGNFTFDTDTLAVDVTNNRVGIGTASPARTLDVRQSGAVTPMQIVATSTNGFSGVVFCDTTGTAKGSTGYGNSATASPYTSTYYMNASSGVDTVWLTDGTERIRMASGGNVTFDTTTLVVDVTNNRIGINKASPTTDLDITGAALISSTLGVTGVTTFGAANTYKGATGITAFAGGGQGSATALTAEVNFVTTVATTGDSVKLPTAALGKFIVVFNDGANSVNIFPISGGQIDALGTNAAYALAAGTSIEFWGKTATDWKSR